MQNTNFEHKCRPTERSNVDASQHRAAARRDANETQQRAPDIHPLAFVTAQTRSRKLLKLEN